MKIYVASSWRNAYQPHVVAQLRADGHEVYDFREAEVNGHRNGFRWSEVDEGWQLWTPARYVANLSHPHAKKGFDNDMSALRNCDACVYVMPCGVSASLEAGWAAGNGKLLVVYVPELREPDLMVKCANLITDDFESVRLYLKSSALSHDEPITEEWLSSVGFKWHQFDRQPCKQWLLWLGDVVADFMTSFEDLGVELAPNLDKNWFCWIRGDISHRYSRFIHIRHIKTRAELIRMIEGLTGQGWDPANNISGSMRKPEEAKRLCAEIEQIRQRLDVQMMLDGHPWRDVEKDDSRGRSLPEHMQAAIDSGRAK